jgi:hypothetical protein
MISLFWLKCGSLRNIFKKDKAIYVSIELVVEIRRKLLGMSKHDIVLLLGEYGWQKISRGFRSDVLFFERKR